MADLETIEEDGQYSLFVEKFKPKKTTDDCYTPPNIYNAVKKWACQEYGPFPALTPVHRPFYPGGNYRAFEYEPGCVVIDNPPFSILSEICRWYDARGIRYFLFAPAVTLFSINSGACNYVITDSSITYENGANVKTGFVTNMGNTKILVSPELHDAIEEQNRINTRPVAQLPKYAYPDEVITAATIQKICKYGIRLEIGASDCAFIRSLDSMKASGKTIFGGGFLLSEKAAAEKAAAEKAAAEKAAAEKAAAEKAGATIWDLSYREAETVKLLGRKK